MQFSSIAIAVSVQQLPLDYKKIIQKLIAFLAVQKNNSIQIFLEKTLAVSLDENSTKHNNIKIIDKLANHLKQVDLIIVIGGDGSILHIGRATIGSGVPVIGINKGKLGFLADLKSTSFETSLADIFAGKFVLEQRPVLQLKHYDEFGVQIKTNIAGEHNNGTVYAMNELTIQGDARMISLEISIDGRHKFKQNGDGIMVSTPTGSTGHSLSAGGAIVSPDVCAMSIVPICPHTLSSRPVIIKDTSQVEIVQQNHNKQDTVFWCADGIKLNSLFGYKQKISVSILPNSLTLLHTMQYSFFTNCAEKLGWERSFIS